MTEKHKVSMKDWYILHSGRVRLLEQKRDTDGLTHMEQLLLIQAREWAAELEDKITTFDDEMQKGDE